MVSILCGFFLFCYVKITDTRLLLDKLITTLSSMNKGLITLVITVFCLSAGNISAQN